jgi:hypothetical protein
MSTTMEARCAHLPSPPARPVPQDALAALIEAGLLARGTGEACFAILDGGHHPLLPQRLREAGADHGCLLAANLGASLSACAPHLVRLSCAAARATGLLPHAVVLQPRAGIETSCLRAHLRTWLRIPGLDGRPETFRFHDPVVLRAALVTMPAERRRAFLAPLGEVHVDGVRLDVEANDVDAYRHGAMPPAPMALASVATV